MATQQRHGGKLLLWHLWLIALAPIHHGPGGKHGSLASAPFCDCLTHPALRQPSQAAAAQEAALAEERAARAAAAAEAAGAAAAAAAAAEADLAAVRAEAEARLREHYEASRCALAEQGVQAMTGACMAQATATLCSCGARGASSGLGRARGRAAWPCS